MGWSGNNLGKEEENESPKSSSNASVIKNSSITIFVHDMTPGQEKLTPFVAAKLWGRKRG
jgi:hypothetical protein